MATCLDEDADHPVANVFHEGASFLQSDADHQLLLNIPFAQLVGISGLRIWSEGEEAPSKLKLFINNPTFGFDDAESTVALQEIRISQEGLIDGSPLPLKLVQFRNVHSIQIFVEENHGADITRIRRLDFLGEKTRMAHMKVQMALGCRFQLATGWTHRSHQAIFLIKKLICDARGCVFRVWRSFGHLVCRY